MTADAENFLSVGDKGIVGVQRLMNWLRSFMVWGSAEKEAACDGDSFEALGRLAKLQQWGFRAQPDNILRTPYGSMKLRKDETTTGIIVTDLAASIERCPPAHGRAETIKEIRL